MFPLSFGEGKKEYSVNRNCGNSEASKKRSFFPYKMSHRILFYFFKKMAALDVDHKGPENLEETLDILSNLLQWKSDY